MLRNYRNKTNKNLCNTSPNKKEILQKKLDVSWKNLKNRGIQKIVK